MNFVEVEVELLGKSPTAIQVTDGKREVWIPNSQIHADSEIYNGAQCDLGDGGILIIPDWLAKEKGMKFADQYITNCGAR